MNSRLSWNAYFLLMAKLVASRATCFRAHVGSVIVRDRRAISTGYNGAPRGREHCLERGYCHRNDNNILSGTRLEECASAGAHSELNSIVQAALFGISTSNTDMYISGHDTVCSFCQAAILNAGIQKVFLLNRNLEVYSFSPAENWEDSSIESEQMDGNRLIDIEKEIWKYLGVENE